MNKQIEALSQLTQQKPLDMTKVLKVAENLLPELLGDNTQWKSLMIDYEPPHLMRLYRQIGPIRINLHYFLPTSELPEYLHNTDQYNENLYHPHAWASAMRIVKGSYEQWMGFADRRGLDCPPEKTLHLHHHKGDSYAMNDPWIWHQVIPHKNEAVATVMVTFMPDDWDQDYIKSNKPLNPLTQEQTKFMFNLFQKAYPKQTLQNHPKTGIRKP